MSNVKDVSREKKLGKNTEKVLNIEGEPQLTEEGSLNVNVNSESNDNDSLEMSDLDSENNESLEVLVEELEALKAENEQLQNQYLRAVAEVQNTKNRARIDVENAHKFALKNFVRDLLPILDAMELELKALEESMNDEVKQFIAGSQLTYKMLLDVCTRFGVEQLNPIGEKLNPEFHQAITMQKSQEVESGSVLHVVQKGYLLNNQVVRAAQVIVAS